MSDDDARPVARAAAAKAAETGTGTETEGAEVLADGGGLVSNAGFLLVSRLITAILGWAGTVLIARTLSVEEFGRFTLVFTVLGLMAVVTDMGIGRIAVRGVLGQLGPGPGDFAGAYLVLRTVLGGLGYLVALAVVWGLGYPLEVVGATAVAGIVILVATPSTALDVVFQARLRMRTVSVAMVVGLGSQLALTAAIAAGGGTVLLFTLPAVLCEFVALAWKVPAARRLLRIRLHVDLALWRSMLREALPLTIGFGLATIYYRVDALMLANLDTFEAVGIYGVSYKFIDVLHYVGIAVTTPLLTLLVRAWPDDLPAFRDALRRGTILVALVGGLGLVGLLGYAYQLTETLYGAEYAVGEHATRVLAVSQIFTLLVNLLMTGLVSMGRHRQYPWIMVLGLLLNVSLNFLLVPRFSYEGAAAATLATDVVVLTALAVLFVRVSKVGALGFGRAAGVLPAVAVGLAVAWVLEHGAEWLPWWIAAAIASAAYVLATIVLGLVRAAGVPLPGPLERLSLLRTDRDRAEMVGAGRTDEATGAGPGPVDRP